MKRVLYICPSAGVGGAETFLKQTYKHCNTSEFESHYLLFTTGPLYDWLNEQGANVHLLSFQPRLSRYSDRKKVSEELKNLINKYNFKLVHSTMAYAALFVARRCKQMGVAHIWFQHGPASGWMDRLAAILPHQGLIVNSHYTGKTQRRLENPLRFLVARKTPIEKILLGTEKPEVTPQSVLEFKDQVINETQIPKDALWLSMLCRIQEWKGVHLFVEAIEVLLENKNLPPFHGFVWGEAYKNEKYLQELQEKVRKNNLPIHFMGSTDQPSKALACSDMVVNASTQPEPFGLSIVEGMMVGAIPIVPNEGGPVEIVTNGRDGLHFKARQASSLAQQMKTLLLDKNLRSTLKENTRKIAEQKYCASRVISHLETYHNKFL